MCLLAERGRGRGKDKGKGKGGEGVRGGGMLVLFTVL